MSVLLILFIVIVFLFFLFSAMESVLARRKNPVIGLIMPAFFLVISLSSIITAMERTFVLTMQSKAPVIALLLWVVMLVILNIPTAVTYVIYYRTRKKMGETPWPFNRKKK